VKEAEVMASLPLWLCRLAVRHTRPSIEKSGRHVAID
jgi:hypothetical protein